MQVEIIRAHSDAPVAHNYMGRVTEFDHFPLVGEITRRAGIATMTLPPGVRDTATERYWFNYNPHSIECPEGIIPAAGFLRAGR